jgi:hypothetical protein
MTRAPGAGYPFKLLARPLAGPRHHGTKGHALQRALELQAAFQVVTHGIPYLDAPYWRRLLTQYPPGALDAMVEAIVRDIPSRRFL